MSCPRNSDRVLLGLAALLALVGPLPAQTDVIRVETSAIAGIGRQDGVCRRDPSDVIRLRGLDFVFYTKAVRGALLFPSGYGGTIWYATSSDEGHSWVERGEVVPKGAEGGFDSTATFTPNVIRGMDGEVYVYYTGVGDGFDNRGYEAKNRTAIGAARVEFGDDGELLTATKLNDGRPVLMQRPAAGRLFDSFRVDDASLLVRDGRYWLYYKGRAFEKTPRETRMGVAVSKLPEGPFVKQNEGNAVQPEGHEVLVWAQDGLIASLVTNAGRGLWLSADGIRFAKSPLRLAGRLSAPGAARRELVEHDHEGAIRWGIGIGHRDGSPPFLERFKIQLPSPLSAGTGSGK